MKLHRIALLFSLLLCLAASDVRAQVLKKGEVRINQRTAGTQWLPDVATAADGRSTEIRPATTA